MSFFLSNQMFHNRAPWFVSTALGVTTLVVGVMGLAQPGLALAEEELYKLCSQYPHNSQCEGYEIPITLSRRSGEEGICALNLVQEESLTDRCKVSLEEDQLTVYLETGDPIALLEDERRTHEFIIPLGDISSLKYREDSDIDQGRLVTNVLLFGALGALFTQPEDIIQVEIDFSSQEGDVATEEPLLGADNDSIAVPEVDAAVPDATDMAEQVDSPGATVSTEQVVALNNLIFEADKEIGLIVQENLAQSTGLPARFVP